MATETKAAHTLGPWHVFPARPGIFNDCDVIVSEHCEDAIVCAMGHDLPGVDANARLIAAAPELLDAAKMAYESLRAYQEHLNVGQFNSVEDREAIDYLADAIRKAEGA